MIVILSPAKTLNFKNNSSYKTFSSPEFVNEAQKLVDVLKNFSPANLMDLMDISAGLAELNYMRFQKWSMGHTAENSKQAVFAFNGEVYNGLKAQTLTDKQLNFAQAHLCLLSGMYGALRPLDLIQPYRLEMGTQLSFDNYKNLYAFWNGKINNYLNIRLASDKSHTLVNLASDEYSKSVQFKKIDGKIITPVFKELRGNNYKVITVYAKKARGTMARFIIENQVENPDDLKYFDLDGYGFTESLSDSSIWVFAR
ncbi:MAG: peroxide stress protein YaaA [Bacteroidales bacterium]|nr:peroxide stress protein YaaA [Bacteroidales bacterium]